MRYQVKAAVPVAITPAGPVEYPKIGGYVEIPSREHAVFLQGKGILVKDGAEIDYDSDEDTAVYNLHKMTMDEIAALPDDKFEKLASEDADMRRTKGQSLKDFRDDVGESLKQMAKMSEEPESEPTEKELADMDKNELEAYAKKHFNIDLDKRKGLPKLLEQVEELLTSPNKGE